MDQERYIEITAQTAAKLYEHLPTLSKAFHLTFARAAVGAAEKMAKKQDDSFNWIRSEPEGGMAFMISIWHFMEEFSEKRTGVSRTTQSEEEHKAMGEFSLLYATVLFDVYNQLSNGENTIAVPTTPEMNLTEMEQQTVENRAMSFFNRYLKPQLKFTDPKVTFPALG